MIQLYLTDASTLNVNDERLKTLVSEKRLERACEYRQINAKQGLLACELLLRLHLKRSGYSNCIDEFCYGEYGKPFLNNSVRFSFSHCESFAICAADCCEVGADIERMRTIPETLKKRMYANGDDDTLSGIHLWSAKEAYLKFTGSGLTGDYQLCDVRVTRDTVYNNKTGEAYSLWQHLYKDMVLSVCSAYNADNSEYQNHVNLQVVDLESLLAHLVSPHS